ncbi:MAG TPA: hypothetical protein PLL28_07755 [Chitinophagales bacterium]|nr:hypothetical protein [Saprospiraceae bacterium]HNE47122.1 hypothetical protein [Chitinophagales bacterium]HNN11567.1 hypothetical protein [Bacteroidia bacterium]HNF69257.1 hypothetical protein [Chitinophagales bacterium]HNJ90406.1 hypothetical protein [Chitinophagales bacterium]
MATVALKLKGKENVELIAFAREILLGLAGNALISGTKPQLDELAEAINAFESSCLIQGRPEPYQKKTTRLRRAVLELQLTRIASHVERIADGDPKVILDSGLPIRTRQNQIKKS